MRKLLSLAPETDRSAAVTPPKKPARAAIAGSRLDTLHERAREMRRSPTEAQALLAEALIKAELGKFRFKRHAVIGSAIVDFACLPLKVAVAVEEPDAVVELERRRDRSLADGGVTLLRYSAAEVCDDVDAVVAAIVAAMKARYDAQRARPMNNRARAQTASRGYQR